MPSRTSFSTATIVLASAILAALAWLPDALGETLESPDGPGLVESDAASHPQGNYQPGSLNPFSSEPDDRSASGPSAPAAEQFLGPEAPSLPPDQSAGLGLPRLRESWLYRPLSVGFFLGGVQGNSLIDDWVGEKQGVLGGVRLGWDHDCSWGGEMRFASGSVDIYDTQRAKLAQWEADNAAGMAADNPRRRRFEPRDGLDLFLWDVDLLYYPCGDSALRPYLLTGIGIAHISFYDRLSRDLGEVMVGMPVGLGLKCRLEDWLALRLECLDNIAFAGGTGLNTLHHVSLTGGVEIRFGGPRRAYWPWNPGRHYW
jgi:hypothetical protein